MVATVARAHLTSRARVPFRFNDAAAAAMVAHTATRLASFALLVAVDAVVGRSGSVSPGAGDGRALSETGIACTPELCLCSTMFLGCCNLAVGQRQRLSDSSRLLPREAETFESVFITRQ